MKNEELTENRNHTKRILIKFKNEERKEVVRNCVQSKLNVDKISIGKKLKHTKSELLLLDAGSDFRQVVAELHNHPDVHYAQPDHKLYACTSPISDKFAEQWGLCNTGQADRFGNAGVPGIDINIIPAWEQCKGSESVVVAVVDTGADINHIKLKSNIYESGSDNIQNPITYRKEWDFVDEGREIPYSSIEDRHGTLVSGIIAANYDKFGIIGVAPKVRLLPLRFMSRNHGSTSDAIEAIEYAKAMGVKIVNCSWGDYEANPALLHHIKNSGMLFICAAGNDGMDLTDNPFFPACYDLPNVLSVAAVNNKGNLWALSNYGEQIHVAAPGVSILSTVPSTDDSGYDYDSGTSLAVPHVTGVAALIMSMYKDITPEEVKELIIKNTTPLPGLKGKISTGGIANALKAIESLKRLQ